MTNTGALQGTVDWSGENLPRQLLSDRQRATRPHGRRLPGHPVPREFSGHAIASAMLAFSETWVRA